MFKNVIVSLLLLAAVSTSAVMLLPSSLQASSHPPNLNCTKASAGFLGFPTWYKYLSFTERSAECDITFDYKTDSGKVLLAIFEIILRVAGILAIVFVMWGGIQYQLSQGDSERLAKARSVIVNALIGLVITISATAIVNLVARNLS